MLHDFLRTGAPQHTACALFIPFAPALRQAESATGKKHQTS